MRVAVAAEEFPGGRRSSGAGVKQRDVYFALGERTVDKWQIADDHGEKAEAQAGFGYDERRERSGARDDVAEAEGEEGRGAEVDIGPEAVRCIATLTAEPAPYCISAKPYTRPKAQMATSMQQRNGPVAAEKCIRELF